MEVKPGYKQTEVGLIPDDWGATRLGMIATFKSGDGINISSLPHESSFSPVPVYGGNGIAGYTTTPNVKDPIVIVGRVGQRCGETYLTTGPVWVTDNALYPHRIQHDISIPFLSLALRAVGLNSVKNRNDLPLVTQAILHSVPIALPPTRAEQEAIASALSDADALIESLEQLLAKKRQIKQGAMQELLTGKKRLPGFEVKPSYKQTEVGVIPEDWSALPVQVLATMRSGESITSANIDMFSSFPCYGGNGLRGYTARFTHDGSYALVGRQGALCGNVVAVKGRFFASEHAIVVTPRPDTDIAWLTSVLVRMDLNRFSESSAQPGLSVAKIKSIPTPVPPTLAEQTAIATILTDMDSEIEALEAKLAKVCQLKQGMMQELLTGRIRLV